MGEGRLDGEIPDGVRVAGFAVLLAERRVFVSGAAKVFGDRAQLRALRRSRSRTSASFRRIGSGTADSRSTGSNPVGGTSDGTRRTSRSGQDAGSQPLVRRLRAAVR